MMRLAGEEFCEAILELHNMPNADSRSPNGVVFGKNIRSCVHKSIVQVRRHLCPQEMAIVRIRQP